VTSLPLRTELTQYKGRYKGIQRKARGHDAVGRSFAPFVASRFHPRPAAATPVAGMSGSSRTRPNDLRRFEITSQKMLGVAEGHFTARLFTFCAAQLGRFLVQGGDELRVAMERAMGTAFLIILLARGDAAVNRAALRRRVLLTRHGKLGKDRNHAARHFISISWPLLNPARRRASGETAIGCLFLIATVMVTVAGRGLKNFHSYDSRYDCGIKRSAPYETTQTGAAKKETRRTAPSASRTPLAPDPCQPRR
jgi:hypothetical protein